MYELKFREYELCKKNPEVIKLPDRRLLKVGARFPFIRELLTGSGAQGARDRCLG
jgi:hypothetical protein